MHPNERGGRRQFRRGNWDVFFGAEFALWGLPLHWPPRLVKPACPAHAAGPDRRFARLLPPRVDFPHALRHPIVTLGRKVVHCRRHVFCRAEIAPLHAPSKQAVTGRQVHPLVKLHARLCHPLDIPGQILAAAEQVFSLCCDFDHFRRHRSLIACAQPSLLGQSLPHLVNLKPELVFGQRLPVGVRSGFKPCDGLQRRPVRPVEIRHPLPVKADRFVLPGALRFQFLEHRIVERIGLDSRRTPRPGRANPVLIRCLPEAAFPIKDVKALHIRSLFIEFARDSFGVEWIEPAVVKVRIWYPTPAPQPRAGGSVAARIAVTRVRISARPGIRIARIGLVGRIRQVVEPVPFVGGIPKIVFVVSGHARMSSDNSRAPGLESSG